MMCRCKFTECNKCTTQGLNVDGRGDCACAGGMGEDNFVLSVLSTQFCYEPKTALKNKVYF